MTETTTTQSERPHQPRPGADDPVNPADLLFNLVVLLLAPMFLGVSGGDVSLAQMAAFETVNSYRVRDPLALLAVAQMIACGLAALGSLSLSLQDDISLPMALRLRGNANALNRTIEHNRRALRRDPSASDPTAATQSADTASTPENAAYEAALQAAVEATRQRLAASRCEPPQLEPAPILTRSQIVAPQIATPEVTTRQTAAPTASIQAPTERERQAMWAAAMTEVAGEFAASVQHLPPAQRKLASVRAAAMSSAANTLLSGAGPARLRPGDIGGLFRPAPV
jgi:hypothetical protein